MLNSPLIDIISRYRPLTLLRQRAMEGRFLTETTIADILADPSHTAFLMRMEPGIGPKSKLQIIAAVHEALDAAFGRDWSESLDSAQLETAQDALPPHAHLQAFLDYWPHPNRSSPNSFQTPANRIAVFPAKTQKRRQAHL